jgi:hypothetical protein
MLRWCAQPLGRTGSDGLNVQKAPFKINVGIQPLSLEFIVD